MQPFGMDLPAHLRQRRALRRRREAVRGGGIDAHARVVLHAHPVAREVLEVDVLHRVRELGAGGDAGGILGPRGLERRQLQADAGLRIARAALDRPHGRGMRLDQPPGHSPEQGRVAQPGREHALSVAHQRDDLRLVDRGGERHQVAERGRDALAVAREALDRVGRQPAAGLRQPARQREVVQRDERRQAELLERAEHAPVVLERRRAELPRRRLDARPLERHPVRVLPQPGQQREVLGVAVELVDRVAGGLDAGRVRRVLPGPPVVVDVAALDLVGRGR